MSALRTGNRRYLLRLWVPTILFCIVVGAIFVAALDSGQPARSVPAAAGILFAALAVISMRWYQKRRVARALRSADPTNFLRSFAASTRRIPHGSLFAAANSATILALYGRFDEAEQAVASVSWRGAPPLVQAQGSIARAAITYARGAVREGLEYAVAATQQASTDPAAPGSRTSELAFRTYRNLGLALAGQATDATQQELRVALERLPLLGQLLAAWGLALIAKSEGRHPELHTMRAFISARAPYFAPVLKSIDGA